MRKFAPCLCGILLGLTAGCTDRSNHIGNPLFLPMHAIGNATSNAAYNQTRGQVEIFVKTNHPALVADIRAGGGPTLTQAFDLANVPSGVRAGQTLKLQSDLAIYSNNPGALVVAIMVASN